MFRLDKNVVVIFYATFFLPVYRSFSLEKLKEPVHLIDRFIEQLGECAMVTNTWFVTKSYHDWMFRWYKAGFWIMLSLKKALYNIMPETEEILKTLGEQIRLARLRRNLSVNLISERAGISRATLWKVEKGNPAVAMGIYAAVLHALNNMDKDLLLVAKDDAFGRQLQDLELITRKRATRRTV